MSDFTLTVIGCDGSWPRPSGACSSYLLRTSTTAVLVDMGTGSLANLQHHMHPSELDAIVLSHEHPDHCSDIGYLDVLLKLEGHSSPPVYAAAGVKEQVFPRSSPQTEMTWSEIEDGDNLEIGDLRFTFSKTDHAVNTLAMRVEHNGRSIIYSADTGTKWSMSSLGGSVNLALCEAAFPASHQAPGHLSSREAAQLATITGAQRLMLTHIRPTWDRIAMQEEAKQSFNGEVLLAEAGNIYDI